MGKWAWSALEGGADLWLDIVKGDVSGGWAGNARQSGIGLLNPNSRMKGWWGEVIKCIRDDLGGWLELFLERRVGNGENTSFWDDKWIGEASLQSKFPRLYELSVNKSCSVAKVGFRVENRWEWSLGWRRDLRVWESDSLNNLLELINCRNGAADDPDTWLWMLESNGSFSVRSAYTKLLERKLQPEQRTDKLCGLIWGNLAILKVQATAWRIIFRKIASISELMKRGVITSNVGINCLLCGSAEETIDHLFVECSRSLELWSFCLNWIGVDAVLSNKVHENFFQFCFLAIRKKDRQFLATVWACMVWLIWRQRNEVVFNNGVWKADKLLGELKSHVWCWLTVKKCFRN